MKNGVGTSGDLSEGESIVEEILESLEGFFRVSESEIFRLTNIKIHTPIINRLSGWKKNWKFFTDFRNEVLKYLLFYDLSF